MAGADLSLPCLLMCLLLLCGGLARQKQMHWLKVQDLEVQEGLCAFVNCTFYFPNLQWYSDIKVYWFRKNAYVYSDPPVATNNEQREVSSDTQGRFHLHSSPHFQNCSLSISDARMSDNGTYFFRVEPRRDGYSYNKVQQLLHIWVKALTQKPTIHIPEPLVSGRTGCLICSLPGACNKTKLRFSWAGDMINPNTEASSELCLTPSLQDQGRNLSCQVTVLSTRESTESTIQLNVSYPPQNLSTHISIRAASGLGGQSVQLLCRADSNPPAELRWFSSSLGTETAPPNDTASENATIPGNATTPENATTPGNITTFGNATTSGNATTPGNATTCGNATARQNMATLELHLAEIPEDAEFICQARNYLGSQTASVRLSGFWPPQLLGLHCSWEAQALSCSCSALGRPVPALHWWLGPELLPENYSDASIQLSSITEEPWANSSLRLPRALDAGHMLSCEASNAYGAQRSSIQLLPGKPQALSAVVPGALGVAGALTLLSLCMCLIAITCMVRVRRKSLAAGTEAVASEDPVMDSVPWNLREKHSPDTHPDQGEDSQELHYASLSFHGTKPKESQDPTASESTEYSEIKTNK